MNKLKLRILVSAAVIGFMAFSGIVSAQQSYGRYYNDLEREFLENTGITNYQRKQKRDNNQYSVFTFQLII